MTSIARIVVGTDNSSRSLTALRYAGALSKRASRPLTAVHAYIYPPDHYFLPDMMFGNMRLQDETVQSDAQNALEGQAQIAALQDVRCVVQPGSAHDALLGEAAEESLIVVGHNHRKAASRALAGSVATRVVRKARGPVLVVPPGDVPGLPKKILIADDFSEPAEAIVPTLAALGLLRDMNVEVAYVLEQAIEPVMHAIENVEKEMPKRWEAMQKGFEQMLEKRYKWPHPEHSGSWKTVVLRGEYAADTLIEYAQKENFDMIAVAASGKGAVERVFLGSTTEALLHQTPVPLLVTHS